MLLKQSRLLETPIQHPLKVGILSFDVDSRRHQLKEGKGIIRLGSFKVIEAMTGCRSCFSRSPIAIHSFDMVESEPQRLPTHSN